MGLRHTQQGTHTSPHSDVDIAHLVAELHEFAQVPVISRLVPTDQRLELGHVGLRQSTGDIMLLHDLVHQDDQPARVAIARLTVQGVDVALVRLHVLKHLTIVLQVHPLLLTDVAATA